MMKILYSAEAIAARVNDLGDALNKSLNEQTSNGKNPSTRSSR